MHRQLIDRAGRPLFLLIIPVNVNKKENRVWLRETSLTT